MHPRGIETAQEKISPDADPRAQFRTRWNSPAPVLSKSKPSVATRRRNPAPGPGNRAEGSQCGESRSRPPKDTAPPATEDCSVMFSLTCGRGSRATRFEENDRPVKKTMADRTGGKKRPTATNKRGYELAGLHADHCEPLATDCKRIVQLKSIQPVVAFVATCRDGWTTTNASLWLESVLYPTVARFTRCRRSRHCRRERWRPSYLDPCSCKRGLAQHRGTRRGERTKREEEVTDKGSRAGDVLKNTVCALTIGEKIPASVSDDTRSVDDVRRRPVWIVGELWNSAVISGTKYVVTSKNCKRRGHSFRHCLQ